MEEWKNIEWSVGNYQISSFGRVRVITDNEERILKQTRIGKERFVSIPIGEKYKVTSVKYLVADHFLPESEKKGKYLCHKDGDNENNNVDNLVYYVDLGLKRPNYKPRAKKPIGERKPRTPREKKNICSTKERKRRTSVLLTEAGRILKERIIVGYSLNDGAIKHIYRKCIRGEKFNNLTLKLYLGEESIPEEDNPKCIHHLTSHFNEFKGLPEQEFKYLSYIIAMCGFKIKRDAIININEDYITFSYTK